MNSRREQVEEEEKSFEEEGKDGLESYELRGIDAIDFSLSPAEQRIQWLERERLRLLQLARTGGSRSSVHTLARQESEALTKSFSVIVKLALDKENQGSNSTNAIELFKTVAGVGLCERDGSLVVSEFCNTSPGPVEASGHVGVGDWLVQVQGCKVNSIEDLGAALAKCKPGKETRLGFQRLINADKPANATMSTRELIHHIEKLEGELKYARAEYARLDIGALEGLQVALNDSRRRVTELQDLVEGLRSGEGGSDCLDREVLHKFEEKEAECRRLYNTLIDLKGAIRVFVRVRPAVTGPKTRGSDVRTVVHVPKERNIVISDPQTPHISEKSWDFDAVFAPHATQDKVYVEVEPLVHGVVDGNNACVFAYGQTGSGKTYTMDGPANNPGVYHRATETLFQAINKRKYEVASHERVEFSVKVSVIEIYQERVRDLLDPNLASYETGSPAPGSWGRDDDVNVQPFSLEIKSHPKTGYVYVQDAQEIPASTKEELHALIEKGKKYRVVGETTMNDRSSRSHLVILISVTSEIYDLDGDVPKTTTRSKLQLIDLAGSERVNTSNYGNRLKETGSINKSLSALGDVMHALQSDESRHIPYRNSKLTSLLRDSLGGRAKTLMMIQVSPLRQHAQETFRTLEFAQRVGKICLGNSNNGSKDAKQLQRLKRENIEMTTEMDKLRERIFILKGELDNDRSSTSKSKDSSSKHRENQLLSRQRQLEDEIQNLRKEHELATESQDELGHLRAYNNDLKRDNQELQLRLMALEQRLANKGAEMEGGRQRSGSNSSIPTNSPQIRRTLRAARTKKTTPVTPGSKLQSSKAPIRLSSSGKRKSRKSLASVTSMR